MNAAVYFLLPEITIGLAMESLQLVGTQHWCGQACLRHVESAVQDTRRHSCFTRRMNTPSPGDIDVERHSRCTWRGVNVLCVLVTSKNTWARAILMVAFAVDTALVQAHGRFHTWLPRVYSTASIKSARAELKCATAEAHSLIRMQRLSTCVQQNI